MLWVLDKIYSEAEPELALEEAKLSVRRRIYASQYLTLAEKYFGAGMTADARRCYWLAMRNQPGLLLQMGVLRRLLATMTSRRLYESAKGFIRFESH